MPGILSAAVDGIRVAEGAAFFCYVTAAAFLWMPARAAARRPVPD